jgi:5-methylcytosine-specific restriction protein A
MGSIGLKPGDVRSREDIQRDWGGGIQGGIIPSDTTPNVFIYSDPAEAARYGYHWDGWSTDQNNEPVFLYTGTGNYGDQSTSGFNGSVLRHKERGRSLHLFLFHSDRGRGGKLHTYVGEFEVDPGPAVREGRRS